MSELTFNAVLYAGRVARYMNCQCICHEVFGGGAHENQTCRCKGGAGFNDLGDSDGDSDE
jgi:hypothetical protein